MNTGDNCEINERRFEYGKTYYFDKSGITMEETEVKALISDCIPVVEACCRLELPKGFRFAYRVPGMCFDLSDLSCMKAPLMCEVDIPACDKKHPVKCELVGGYEIRVVGDVHFSVSSSIYPICGFCFPRHSQVCCNETTSVNEVISYCCSPKPCPPGVSCIDWCFMSFTVYREKDCCGPYLRIVMKLGLEYNGVCECDEE